MGKQQTKTIPADELVIGAKFIPAGKKRHVEILSIADFTPARLEMVCTSPYGTSIVYVSRYDMVEAVIPATAKRRATR